MPRFSQPDRLTLEGWHEAFVGECKEGKTKKGKSVVLVRFDITNSEGTFPVRPKFGAVYNEQMMMRIFDATNTIYSEDKDVDVITDKAICILLEVDDDWGSQVVDYRKSASLDIPDEAPF